MAIDSSTTIMKPPSDSSPVVADSEKELQLFLKQILGDENGGIGSLIALLFALLTGDKQMLEKTSGRSYDTIKNQPMSNFVPQITNVELNSELKKAMAKDPKITEYVSLTMAAAQKYGLDGNMLANQFYQESGYDPTAGSDKGALGIAQIIPATAKLIGLDPSERNDPHKSIEYGARLMADLTKKLGSQTLALVAYNGGEKAITFVKDETRDHDVTIDEWMSFMKRERDLKGEGPNSAWRNETFEYVLKITGAEKPEKTATPNTEVAGVGTQKKGELSEKTFADAAANPANRNQTASPAPVAASPAVA